MNIEITFLFRSVCLLHVLIFFVFFLSMKTCSVQPSWERGESSSVTFVSFVLVYLFAYLWLLLFSIIMKP